MPVALRPSFLLALLAALAVVLLPTATAHAQGSLSSAQSDAAALRAAVAAEQHKIDATQEGLAQAESRLAALQARAQTRTRQLNETQSNLVSARAHLTTLQSKQARDQKELAANLVASYEAGPASYVNVIMDANGFQDLLDRFAFIRRVTRRNASILGITRTAKTKVQGQTKQLDAMRTHYSVLAKDAVEDAHEADVVRGALLQRQAAQLETRNGTQAKLANVHAKIAAIERRQAAAARAARLAATAAVEAPRELAGATTQGVSTAGGGGDAVVARVVAAATQIATTPYVWGGGHGGTASGGFDCSGSVSYALAAGGLLNGSLTSTGFESWGDAGPGRRITVYANAGHAFMIVDGRRFDTVALSEYGTRWTSVPTSTAGFVARHPPGL